MSAGGKTVTWKAHRTGDDFIDFRESFDPRGGEYVAGYAVAYVIADAPMNVTLCSARTTKARRGSTARGLSIRGNARARKTRPRAGRSDKVRTCSILKVINEANNWQACARFLRGETPGHNPENLAGATVAWLGRGTPSLEGP